MIGTLFAWMAQPEAWLAFGTLLLLEIVLGIDNVIFISILSGKLPPNSVTVPAPSACSLPPSPGYCSWPVLPGW